MRTLVGDLGDIAIWISSIGIVIWVVQYSLLSPWWKDTIGITMIGEALIILAIYIPTLLALADPAGFAGFATAGWYLWLTAAIVIAGAVFIVTRIVVWERIRRQRNHGLPRHDRGKHRQEVDGMGGGDA